MIKSINPASGKTIETYTEASSAEIEAVLVQAQTSFRKWRQTELAERVSCVNSLAKTLEKTKEHAAKTMTNEMGKTYKDGLAEIEKCIKYCRYTADIAPKYLEDEPVVTEYKQSYTRPLPLGTILLVMPWNFPFWQVIRVAVAAILSGNTCVLKHASNVPACALLLEDVFKKAGFPAGVFQTLLIGSNKVAAILADDRIMGASVTGSERAGSAVAATCGKYIKPCVLELGGADPFIVMPSADLSAAIDHAITGRMRNNGQSCIAAKRLIVHADIYAEFKTRFMEKVNAIIIGDPMHKTSNMGPLSSLRALNDVQKQIKTAISQGATITNGDQTLPNTGFYMRPGIIEDATKDMAVYHQEIFAPIAMLFKVSNLNEAINLANDSTFGLSSVLFSHDEAEQTQAINQLQAGSTYINRYASSDIRMPFGGIKNSGFGREMAKEGLRAFTNLKTIIIAN